MGRPWPQQAQNPALKMHIASPLDFSPFFFFSPQRAAVIYSHQTGLLPCTSPAHVSLWPPCPQRMKTTWPQRFTPLDPCRQLVNPTNSSPSQQKTLGTDKNQQVGRELCWCLQPLTGWSPSCSWQWFSWWQAQPGRDKLGCTGHPPSLRIKKSQSNIDN